MKEQSIDFSIPDIKILLHHIYEYKKGIRDMVLQTMHVKEKVKAIIQLRKHNIKYLIQSVSNTKINIFFGNSICINVIKSIGDKPLTEFTLEEDFILGTMLGYSRLQQCERYLKRKEYKHTEEGVFQLIPYKEF